MGISIHALREEGDRPLGQRRSRSWEFLSTPSARRATDGNGTTTGTIKLFLSTPSARRATAIYQSLRQNQLISIHALREEGDGLHHETLTPIHYISIHALREEGDGSALPCRT